MERKNNFISRISSPIKKLSLLITTIFSTIKTIRDKNVYRSIFTKIEAVVS